MGSGVYIDVPGRDAPVDLADVNWLQETPCGCLGGCTSAVIRNSDGTVKLLVTPAQALAWFATETFVARWAQLGFSAVAVHRQDAATLLAQGCRHTPQYGLQPLPTEPTGYRWMALTMPLKEPRPNHLVAVVTDGGQYTRPLCRPSYRLYADWQQPYLVQRYCADCSRAAAGLGQAAS